jgi:hypothetical protein
MLHLTFKCTFVYIKKKPGVTLEPFDYAGKWMTTLTVFDTHHAAHGWLFLRLPCSA